MIQRVQTVYLFLALIFSVLLFLIPFAGLQHEQALITFKYVRIQSDIPILNIKNYAIFPLLVLNVMFFILTLITIFKFKNRSLQSNLCIINLILLAAILLLEYYIPQQIQSQLPAGQAQLKFYLAAFIPVLSIIAQILALRGIKKDQELIKSLDRIR